MMNAEEIHSCIEENLRQNRVYEALIRDLKNFKCPRGNPRHKNFRACSECLGISCMECSGHQACQCWNDE